MTTKTRRMKITIERHDIRIVHGHSGQLQVFCEHCRSKVFGLTPEITADLYRVPVAAINGLLEAAEIHLVKPTDVEQPLICGGSASQQKSNF